MAGYGICQFTISKYGRRQPGFVQTRNIVPMPSKAFAAQSVLKAESMNRSCLPPEGPLSVHKARSSRGESHVVDQADAS